MGKKRKKDTVKMGKKRKKDTVSNVLRKIFPNLRNEDKWKKGKIK
jgi:hypothetical protein